MCKHCLQKKHYTNSQTFHAHTKCSLICFQAQNNDFRNVMSEENIIEKPLNIFPYSIFHNSTPIRFAYGAMICNLAFNYNLELV